MTRGAPALLALVLASTGCSATGPARTAEEVVRADGPRYRPSGRSEEAFPIDSNEYGAFRRSPKALAIGDAVPDFELMTSERAAFRLADVRRGGPVVLVFYRGFW